MSTYTYRDDSYPPPEQRKAVLFCPECGHESPITGDWETVTTGDERLLVCPVCGAVVDRRSRRGSKLVEAA